MDRSAASLLGIYCVLVLVASLAGGWIPLVVRLTHRRLEIALSFVSGVMLGVALLHLLPHALVMQRAASTAGPAAITAVADDPHAHDDAHDHADDHAHDHPGQPDDAGEGGHAHPHPSPQAADSDAAGAVDPHAGHDHGTVDPVFGWLLAGFLVIFLAERFFCFHHHDLPDDEGEAGGGHACGHDGSAGEPGHHHELRWAGAAIGLTLHSLTSGVALAAATAAEASGSVRLAGLGTFLVIALHKPFDSLTIGTLMAASRSSRARRHLVNMLFALAIPIGAALFMLGLGGAGGGSQGVLAAALGFSAGTFLCIALSDLLPELQFHRHDRVKLTIAMLLGVAVAWGVGFLER